MVVYKSHHIPHQIYSSFLLFLSQGMALLSAHLFTLEICKSPSVPLYPLSHISNQETDLIYSTSCYLISYFNVQILCYDINRSDITPRGVKSSYFGKGKWWLILCINLTRLRPSVVWSNPSLHVAIKVFF